MAFAELIEEINAAYGRLEEKKTELARALSPFETEAGWFNGHYQRDDKGSWRRDAYPIPVVSVKGLCDIEVQFTRLSVSTKLKREAALAYSFEQMKAYEFEAYGVEDFLSDYYHAGQTMRELKEKIKESAENEIGFSFSFPFKTDGTQMAAFVERLKREGFYY